MSGLAACFSSLQWLSVWLGPWVSSASHCSLPWQICHRLGQKTDSNPCVALMQLGTPAVIAALALVLYPRALVPASATGEAVPGHLLRRSTAGGGKISKQHLRVAQVTMRCVARPVSRRSGRCAPPTPSSTRLLKLASTEVATRLPLAVPAYCGAWHASSAPAGAAWLMAGMLPQLRCMSTHPSFDAEMASACALHVAAAR